jgi:hypothetical protein
MIFEHIIKRKVPQQCNSSGAEGEELEKPIWLEHFLEKKLHLVLLD